MKTPIFFIDNKKAKAKRISKEKGEKTARLLLYVKKNDNFSNHGHQRE